MTLINILDNEFLDLDDIDVFVDRVRFTVYVKMDEKFILNLNEKCPVMRTRICNPRELEL
jgi:hypothetical protein